MGWNQADLAEVTGAAQPTVSRWIKDGRVTIKPKFAYRIQDASGYSARWILLGEGPEQLEAPTFQFDKAVPHPMRAAVIAFVININRIFSEGASA